MAADPRRRPDDDTRKSPDGAPETDIDRGTGTDERRPRPDISRQEGGERRIGPEDEERRIGPDEQRPAGTMP